MDWLSSLFTNWGASSHIVALYAIVIAVGYILGKVKFGGIALGSTFVLFVGIIVGHVYNVMGIASPEGYACPLSTMNFIQDFGLVLFVYCIGLSVGPGFFSSFKEGGVKMNLLAIVVVLLNVGIMFGLYYLFFDTENPKNLPMMVGVLCGAVTNTPGLGAANETLAEVMSHNDGLQVAMGESSIASAYACAYPLGVLGMIGAVILTRYLLKISLKEEDEAIQREKDANPHARPHQMTIVASNKSLVGKNLFEVSQFLGRNFVCTRIERNGQIIRSNNDTPFTLGDKMRIVCAADDAEAITAFLGDQIEMEWDEENSPVVSRRIIVTKPAIEGKTFGEMHFNSIHGVYVTRFTRSGIEMFADRHLKMQIGDRLRVVGPEENVKNVADLVGNQVKRLDYPNIAPIFIGILLGIALGSIPFKFPGIPNPVKLGIAGGPLIVALLIARFGYKVHLVSYTTTSANMFVRELGLLLFLASVGMKAGAHFWETLIQGDGVKYVWVGFLITVIPILIMGLVARLRYKLNYFTFMGFTAGTYTDPPLLAFSSEMASNDAPAVGYSTVYPLSMFLRILSAQLIILFCCS
ncbi:MAG: putative transporter [Bacteroidaceae bacterium]|nr:putative transporter [Bacteroidaceae bacterium]